VTSATTSHRRAGGSVPRPGNHVLVMFGATGDLARRKLLPGLFHLATAGLMPDRYQIIGSSRKGLTDEQFREHARQAVAEFGTSQPTGAAWQAFAGRLMGTGASSPNHNSTTTIVTSSAVPPECGGGGGSVTRDFTSTDVPKSIPPGEYEVGLALVDAQSTPQVRLAVEGRGGDGWYLMGKTRVKAAEKN